MSDLKIQDSYFAGLFDGEGCVGIYKHKDCPGSLYVRVGCTNTHEESMRAFEARFGGKISVRDRPNRKRQYEWYAYAENARPVLEALLPFLLIKRDKALAALELLNCKKSAK